MPARSGVGDIEWPAEAGLANNGAMVPSWVKARGVAHRYAPLAALRFGPEGGLVPGSFKDLRRKLIRLWE